MHINIRILLIVAILACYIYCQGGGGGDDDGDDYDYDYDYDSAFDRNDRTIINNDQYKTAEMSANKTTYTVETDQPDVDKISSFTVILMLIFPILIIVLIPRWIGSYDTWPPSNTIFVNKDDATSNEDIMEDVENIFPTGHWKSNYFQYKRWHGPHNCSLSFDYGEQTVSGFGEDDVGVFSINGIYSFDTRRIGLTKIYQKGTGNPAENLGHTVTIQLEWNIGKRRFEGKWYVKTNQCSGTNEFRLTFQE